MRANCPQLTTKGSRRVAALPKWPLPKEVSPESFFSLHRGNEGSPLHGPHLGPNAHGQQVVRDRFGQCVVRWATRDRAAVKTVGIARFLQQLLGLLWVVGISFDRQGKLKSPRDDVASELKGP